MAPEGDNQSPLEDSHFIKNNTNDADLEAENANMNGTLRTLPALMAILLSTTCLAAGPEARPAPGDPHAGISCALCHGQRAVRAVTASLAGEPDPRSRACRECHREVRRSSGGATAGRALGFHGDPQADCAGCHSFHETGRLKTAVGDLRTGHEGLDAATTGHCRACHGPESRLANLSPAHREAAALYHRDAAQLAGASPSQGCLNCHAEGSTSSWAREISSQGVAFNLHATHPLGIEVVPGSGMDERRLRANLDPKLPLFDGRLECQTCHDLTAPTTDLLVAFEEPSDLCLGCHKLSNPKSSTERRELLATMVALEKP